MAQYSDIPSAAAMLAASVRMPTSYEDVPAVLRFMAQTSARVSDVLGASHNPYNRVRAETMVAGEVMLLALARNIDEHIGAMLDAHAAEQLDVEPAHRGVDGDHLYRRP